MARILEEKIHVWGGLREYELTPEEKKELALNEYDLKTRIKILKRLKVNEYFSFEKIDGRNNRIDIRNTNTFQRIIMNLNKIGFNIGKGNTKYGYKMPLPKKDELVRELIIFRRW